MQTIYAAGGDFFSGNAPKLWSSSDEVPPAGCGGEKNTSYLYASSHCGIIRKWNKQNSFYV
jgi:hypothetical protein